MCAFVTLNKKITYLLTNGVSETGVFPSLDRLSGTLRLSHYVTVTSHLYSLREFWRHFGLCRAAAHSDWRFSAPCIDILTYLLTSDRGVSLVISIPASVCTAGTRARPPAYTCLSCCSAMNTRPPAAQSAWQALCLIWQWHSLPTLSAWPSAVH